MILKAIFHLARLIWTVLVAGPVTTGVWLIAELLHRPVPRMG